jgi:hypothetical protein
MADDLITRARRYLRKKLESAAGVAPTQTPATGTQTPTAYQTRRKQGPGFWMGDIGEGERSSEPAHGQYEHNSPAKPL